MTTATLTRLESDVKSYLGNVTDEQVVQICDELVDYGIETLEQFEDAFYYTTDSYRADEEFAQHLFEEIECQELHPAIQGCIDWQVVWDSHYRFDFFTINDGENTYYFFNS